MSEFHAPVSRTRGADDYDAPDTNEDPGYDPRQQRALPLNERGYLIPAQDHRGHHTRLFCRAQPALAKMVGDVQASHKYPFRSAGDVVRWCVDHGCRLLLQGAGVPSVMAQADLMISTLVDEEFQMQFLDFFTHLRRVVDNYMEHGSPAEAKRVVVMARSQIAQMPEGYWRSRYEEELTKRHGALIDKDGVGSWGEPVPVQPAVEDR
jgi:hypothetical protein